MTDAGPLDLIDDEDSDADDLLPPTLAGGAAGESGMPGTGGRRAPAIRTRHVALSPTGRAWTAATTEGLLLYRQAGGGAGGAGGMSWYPACCAQAQHPATKLQEWL